MIVNDEEKKRMKTTRNCISKSAFTILHFIWLFVITFFHFPNFSPPVSCFSGQTGVFYGGRLFFYQTRNDGLPHTWEMYVYIKKEFCIRSQLASLRRIMQQQQGRTKKLF